MATDRADRRVSLTFRQVGNIQSKAFQVILKQERAMRCPSHTSHVHCRRPGCSNCVLFQLELVGIRRVSSPK